MNLRTKVHWLSLLILIAAVALPAPASAQRRPRYRPPRATLVERYPEARARLGMTVGLDVTQLHMSDDLFDDNSDVRTGPRLGVLFATGFGRGPLLFETGLAYEKKGGKYVYGDGNTRDLISAHYLTIPALFEILLAPSSPSPFLKIGPELSVLVSSNYRREIFDGMRVDYADFEPGFHDLDLGFRLGGGVEFPIGWKSVGSLEAAYVFGLSNISDTGLCFLDGPQSPLCRWGDVRNGAFVLAFNLYGLLD